MMRNRDGNVEAEMFVSQIKNIYMDSIDECKNILLRDLAEMFVSQIKNIYMDSIDECENILLRDLSTKWAHTPTEEAVSILQNATAIMHDVLNRKMEEQREAILDATWKYVEDRENGSCTSPKLMYEALAPVEKAIKQAVSEFTQEKQKNYKKYSLIWHWCNYILYMVKNVVTTFAGKMQKGMEESLKSA